MNRRHALMFFALSGCGVRGSRAAGDMEIIELRSRTVEEVLPVLLPLVEPGGTLTGMNNQLFLRASAANRAEIRRALASLDRPAKRLIIRVTEDREVAMASRGATVGGQVVMSGTGSSRIEARVWDSDSGRRSGNAQMVQTMDGGRAFIRAGRSLAIPFRQAVMSPGGAIVSENIVYRDAGQGFYASPRLQGGERVRIEITQQADQFTGGRRGDMVTQSLSTTVQGRLGEWIELGGVGREASGRQEGGFSVGTRDVRDQRSIWLKVEAVE